MFFTSTPCLLSSKITFHKSRFVLLIFRISDRAHCGNLQYKDDFRNLTFFGTFLRKVEVKVLKCRMASYKSFSHTDNEYLVLKYK